MAHPKSRVSKQRKRKRRTHYVSAAPNVGKCNNCGAPQLFHHVCGVCGFYRGKQAVVIAKAEVSSED
jgi:large subunit ribosomal protein L32